MRVHAYNPGFFEKLVDVSPVVYPSLLVPFSTLEVGQTFILPTTKGNTYRGNVYYRYEPTEEIIGYKLLRGSYYSVKEIENFSFIRDESEKIPIYGRKEVTKFRPYVYKKIKPSSRPNYGFELNVRLLNKSNGRGTHSGYLSPDTLVESNYVEI